MYTNELDASLSNHTSTEYGSFLNVPFGAVCKTSSLLVSCSVQDSFAKGDCISPDINKVISMASLPLASDTASGGVGCRPILLIPCFLP